MPKVESYKVTSVNTGKDKIHRNIVDEVWNGDRVTLIGKHGNSTTYHSRNYDVEKLHRKLPWKSIVFALIVLMIVVVVAIVPLIGILSSLWDI